jgi:hypothetical protein
VVLFEYPGNPGLLQDEAHHTHKVLVNFLASLVPTALDSKELSMGLVCASQMHINISLINVLQSSVEKMMQGGRRYILPPGRIAEF